MGCTDSSVYTAEVFTQLSDQNKLKLRGIIKHDDLISLIQFENQENYPNWIEMSETGLLWTPIHFCCRYDSPTCLDYFLKKCYLQNVKQYLQLVNSATAEGSTCLHLCGIWGAIRCFALLLNYGGLNLSSKDKLQKTIQNTMQDYRHEEMEEVVSILKGRFGSVTPWNFEELECIPDVEAMKNEAYFKDMIEKIKKGLSTGEYSKEKLAPSVKEVQLREKKGILELEKEEIRQELSKIEKQIAQELAQKSTEDNAAPGKADIFPQKYRVKNEEEIKLNSKLKVKEQDVQLIKQEIEKLQVVEANDKLKEETEKAVSSNRKLLNVWVKFEQFKDKLKAARQNNENQIDCAEGAVDSAAIANKNALAPPEANQIVQPVTQLTQQQQNIITELKALYINDYKPEGLQNFPLFPENLRRRYEEAKKTGSFIDEQFPHSQDSLGGAEYQAKIQPFIAALKWLRPTSFLNADFQLFDGIDPNDIKQGQLGVCYCLATISSLARNPQNIKRIFKFWDLQLGFYVLRFYSNGKLRYIVVDDYFPCNGSTKQPLFTKPIGNQIWVLLIEKAWSKIIGSYFGAELMSPDIFIEDLTGSPTYGAWFKDKTEKTKDIITYSTGNYPIVLTTGPRQIQGIVNHHAYTLLNVIEHNGAHIYKLRNPWGRFEWNGCYGDQSSLWTPELKAKSEEVAGDDGVFFLSQSELLQAFDYYSIGFDQMNCKYSYVQLSSNPDESLYFKFTLTKPQCMALRLTQLFKRAIKDKQYKYSSVIFQLGKIEGDKVKFIAEGNDRCYSGDKSVYISNDIFKVYEKGDYFVRVKVLWNDPTKYRSAVLSVFCGQPVEITPFPKDKGYQLWKKLLFNFITAKPLNNINESVAYSMQWMRGQMVCYSILRDNAKPGNYKVKWIFKPAQLNNCILQMGKTNDSTIQFSISSKNKSGFGTLDRIQLAKPCQSGSVSIQPVKE